MVLEIKGAAILAVMNWNQLDNILESRTQQRDTSETKCVIWQRWLDPGVKCHPLRPFHGIQKLGVCSYKNFLGNLLVEFCPNIEEQTILS